MGRHRLSGRAESDLEEIADYIARDSHKAALAFVSRLHELCGRLAGHPNMGIPCPQFKGGNIRSFPMGSYMVFYRKTATGIEVARIIHGARDMNAQLG